jgi:hypothetical protein
MIIMIKLCSLLIRCSLVDDVLGEGAGDKVPMEKVVMLIWQFRDDPSVITFMARFMGKVCMAIAAWLVTEIGCLCTLWSVRHWNECLLHLLVVSPDYSHANTTH